MSNGDDVYDGVCGYGLVARDVAATVEANPKIWIEPDGAKRERVGDLLAAVLDAHARRAPSMRRNWRTPRRNRRRVRTWRSTSDRCAPRWRDFGTFELEMLNGDGDDDAESAEETRSNAQATTSANRGVNASPREIEAERRELQETLAEVQTQMRRLEEKSGAIETELRDQLEASKKESSETRDELERVLRERNLVVNELEVELKRLEEAQRVAGEETADAVRRAREDVEQDGVDAVSRCEPRTRRLAN